MSQCQVDLCSRIVKEYFGDVVADVAMYLVRNGASSLKLLSSRTGISEVMTKKCLWTLIHHNLVSYKMETGGFPVYSVSITNIQSRIWFFHYIYAARNLFGNEAELIIDEMMKHGQIEMNNIITSLSERLIDPANGRQKLRDKFNQLAQTHFIIRCPTLVAKSEETKSDRIPSFKTDDTRLFDVPKNDSDVLEKGKRKRIIYDDEEDDLEPATKKSRSDSNNQTKADDTVYWRVNTDRFSDHLRDQMIIDAIRKKINESAADVVQSILRLSEVKTPENSLKSAAVSYNEIFQNLHQHLNLTRQTLDQILKILTEVALNFVIREGDSGGGMYCIHFQKAFIELCRVHVDSVVQERYGSKSLRIFRVITLKKQLEQKQVEELVMIDPKETKEHVYRLLEDMFLSLTEVPRTPDHAPLKTIFLFSINLNHVARMILDRCYKGLSNLISRRWHETQTNKRVVDKQRRMEAILAQIDDPEQREEFEEQMTAAEKAQVEKFKRVSNTLELAELQLSDTIFILETYLTYSLMK